MRALELRFDHRKRFITPTLFSTVLRRCANATGRDGAAGFPGMDVTTEAAANDFDPDSHFLVWKPGTVPTMEPPTWPGGWIRVPT